MPFTSCNNSSFTSCATSRNDQNEESEDVLIESNSEEVVENELEDIKSTERFVQWGIQQRGDDCYLCLEITDVNDSMTFYLSREINKKYKLQSTHMLSNSTAPAIRTGAIGFLITHNISYNDIVELQIGFKFRNELIGLMLGVNRVSALNNLTSDSKLHFQDFSKAEKRLLEDHLAKREITEPHNTLNTIELDFIDHLPRDLALIQTQIDHLFNQAHAIHAHGTLLKASPDQAQAKKGATLRETAVKLKEHTLTLYQNYRYPQDAKLAHFDFDVLYQKVLATLDDASKTIRSHRQAWKPIGANVALFLTGVGAFALGAKYAIAKKNKQDFVPFFYETRSQGDIEAFRSLFKQACEDTKAHHVASPTPTRHILGL